MHCLSLCLKHQTVSSLTFLLFSSSSCIFTWSFLTITCLFHSGMARPCSSCVGTRLSTSTILDLLWTTALFPLTVVASCSLLWEVDRFWGDPPLVVGVGGVDGQIGGGDSGFADWVSLGWGFGRGSGGDVGRSSWNSKWSIRIECSRRKYRNSDSWL